MSGGWDNPHISMGRNIPGGAPGIPGGGFIRAQPMRAQGAHKGPARKGPVWPARGRPRRAE